MKKILISMVFLTVIPVISYSFDKVIIKPVHYEAKDKEFKKVYVELLNIIKNKKYNKIHNYLSEQHVSLFDCSKSNFDQCWNMNKNNYKKSHLWKVLEKSLLKGCAKNGKFIFCPYYYNTMPNNFDAHESGFVDGVNVNIRFKPSSKSKIITNRSYEFVKRDLTRSTKEETINNEEYSWIPIITYDGLKGYVFGKYFSGALDCRVGFIKEKEKEKWKIKFIACGD